jgi:hypothetical protein
VLTYFNPVSSRSTVSLALGRNDLTHQAINNLDASGFNAPNAMAIDTSSTPNIFMSRTRATTGYWDSALPRKGSTQFPSLRAFVCLLGGA